MIYYLLNSESDRRGILGAEFILLVGTGIMTAGAILVAMTVVAILLVSVHSGTAQ